MSWPKSYSAYRRSGGSVPQSLELTQEQLPDELGPHDVLLKIHAVSLNFRDAGMLHGRYPMSVEENGIPTSDCAAEVIGVGKQVAGYKVGDRVTPIPDFSNLTGHEAATRVCIGANAPGVLREYAVYEDKYLVHLPKHLSWEEGASLACACLTAWNSLKSVASVPEGSSALLQGTGGVSMCALLICLGAGITPIITSSSDEKLEAVKSLSPKVRTINYKTCPDQAAEVQRITSGRGVEFVINNTGPGSVLQDVGFLCVRGGTVALVGFLGGFDADWDRAKVFTTLMGKTASLQGIAMGSKKDFENMNKFLEEKKISLKPIIDRVFPFAESKEAFDYLYLGKHTGKVVITM
ncbi:alcohol dehydrogenase [Hypoxylon cercidicola]|nr:alcohol dehydrogenase [Hypoxylon cercidicola]